MSVKCKPPFRAEHIGSLLRPPSIPDAFRAHRKGELDDSELRMAREDAIRDVVKLQEDVGLQFVTDGEFRRTTYISHFVESCDGLDFRPSSFRFYDTAGKDHEFLAPACVGKVKWSQGLSAIEFDFLTSITQKTIKSTYASPATMHFLGGAPDPDPEFYADDEALFADIAAAYNYDISDIASRGARYVALDDVPFPMLCDPLIRGQLEKRGKDPEKLLDQYIDLTNASFASAPSDMTVGLHMCRGNLKVTWLSVGSYLAISEKLFNKLNVDVFFLEYDTDRAGGFEPLAAMPDNKMVVLGLVSSKLP
ncbi:MAG: 5-methyltetrahydropteroyltriglutamate--homocysteine S-methyltransferase, partial [Pseudomonadota bacterium]|nr:5-methyltetrahydropteroyltriglutamate--homocysteine S-methyltransferase [Pseudomonadota bacterium]